MNKFQLTKGVLLRLVGERNLKKQRRMTTFQ